VGKEDYFYKRLKEMIREEERKKIIFTDFIEEAVLADLYRGARLYVFPSFIEGFGLPGLEAMNYGLPVVASNSSCLEEIYGDAATYFNPYNKNDIIEKVERVFFDENVRKELVEKGFMQIKKYGWESLARKTLQIYKTH
jgi:glycosyltransferase involved in cell wall biosynthesis